MGKTQLLATAQHPQGAGAVLPQLFSIHLTAPNGVVMNPMVIPPGVVGMNQMGIAAQAPSRALVAHSWGSARRHPFSRPSASKMPAFGFQIYGPEQAQGLRAPTGLRAFFTSYS